MKQEVRELLVETISASIKHYEEFRSTYIKNEWTNEQLAAALMKTTLPTQFKKLNLLNITQQSEQLPRFSTKLKGHDKDCTCDACNLLENIFGNCG
jgi:hypothetical protein